MLSTWTHMEDGCNTRPLKNGDQTEWKRLCMWYWEQFFCFVPNFGNSMSGVTIDKNQRCCFSRSGKLCIFRTILYRCSCTHSQLNSSTMFHTFLLDSNFCVIGILRIYNSQLRKRTRSSSSISFNSPFFGLTTPYFALWDYYCSIPLMCLIQFPFLTCLCISFVEL